MLQYFFIPTGCAHKKQKSGSNRFRRESSIERIVELGRKLEQNPHSCPFTVTNNTRADRIPSTIYEIECLHCHDCGSKTGNKCMQLESTILATYTSSLADKKKENAKSKPISIKTGCACMPVVPESGNILRLQPKKSGRRDKKVRR